MTRYISTRGQSPAIGFLDAVLAGLAPDGGLYSPEVWPTFTQGEIAAFAGMPYAQVAAAVLGKFAGDDIDAASLRAMCEEAYATFSHKAVTPLAQIGDNLFLLAETSSNPDWAALKPAPLPAEIPNNHLQYVLTWFGLAAALAGVYAAALWRRLKD